MSTFVSSVGPPLGGVTVITGLTVKMARLAIQAIPDATETVVDLDTVITDLGEGVIVPDVVGNRINIRQSGIYLFNYFFRWAAGGAVGARQGSVNDAGLPGSYDDTFLQVGTNLALRLTMSQTIVVTVDPAVGVAGFDFRVLQVSGGPLNLELASFSVTGVR